MYVFSKESEGGGAGASVPIARPRARPVPALLAGCVRSSFEAALNQQGAISGRALEHGAVGAYLDVSHPERLARLLCPPHPRLCGVVARGRGR